MQPLMLTIASNAVLAAALAVIVFAVTRVWRNPQFAHALWLLVLIKLVTPPVTWISLPASWWEPDRPAAAAPAAAAADATADLHPTPVQLHESFAANSAVASEERLPEPVIISPEPVAPPPAHAIAASVRQPELLTIEPSWTPLPATDEPQCSRATACRQQCHTASLAAAADSDSPANAAAAPELTSNPPPAGERPAALLAASSATLILAVWLGGAAVFLTILVARCRRVQQILAASIPAGDLLRLEARRLAETLGMRRVPDVRVVEARIPPLVWGAARGPLVLLPRELIEGMSPAERRSVLVHELAHIRRRDHLVRWLEILILVPFWWNPVAWWSRRQLRIAEEECCDAWVVWALPDSRRSYGRALLRTIEFLTEPRTATAMAASPFGRFPFRRRIEMILKRDLSRRMSWTACVLVAGLAAGVLPLAAQTEPDVPPATSEASSDADTPTSVPAAPVAEDSPTPQAETPAAPAVAPPAIIPDELSAAAPPAVSREPVIAEQPTERLPKPDVAPPAVDSIDTASPSARFPSDTAPPARPPADQANLEARIQRLEALVERLIASQEPGRAVDPETRDTPGRLIGPAESPDGKLTAYLEVADTSSRIRIHDVASGRQVWGTIAILDRASAIQFSRDGQTLKVLFPRGDWLFDVRTGRVVASPPSGGDATDPLTGDSTVPDGGKVLLGGVENATEPRMDDATSSPRPQALAHYLRQWAPQRKLLEIDLQQAELELEAAGHKLAALQELRQSGGVTAAEVDEQQIKVRQAQLNITRARTQLELHDSRRTAFEEELSRSRAYLDESGLHLEVESTRRRRDPTPEPGRSQRDLEGSAQTNPTHANIPVRPPAANRDETAPRPGSSQRRDR